MVSNTYAVSFYFVLLFKGEKIAFQEISGMAEEMSVEEVVCGGENRFKYKLPTVATGQNLVLKRALVPVASKLVNWRRAHEERGAQRYFCLPAQRRKLCVYEMGFS
jgi:phage tail-like protein